MLSSIEVIFLGGRPPSFQEFANCFEPSENSAINVLKQAGPPYFVYLKSYLFCELKPHPKFQNPRTKEIKVTQTEERKKEKEKNAVKRVH